MKKHNPFIPQSVQPERISRKQFVRTVGVAALSVAVVGTVGVGSRQSPSSETQKHYGVGSYGA